MWIEEVFGFSKRERNGTITLLLILIFVWFLPDLFPDVPEIDPSGLQEFRQKLASLDQPRDSSLRTEKSLPVDTTSFPNEQIQTGHTGAGTGYFRFDPNELSASGWKKLGVNEKTIRTIHHYLEKGGKFKSPGDLKRIYGFSEQDYKRLSPFVSIASDRPDSIHSSRFRRIPEWKQNYPPASNKIVDINAADTSVLISLPGIGSKLARRIVNFREKLGGFYAVDQISEIYGLPDSVYAKIRDRLSCTSGQLKKINVNTADYEVLSQHPYFNYSQARSLIQYRQQHGSFIKVEDIRKIFLADEKWYQKVSPYLTIN